MKASERYKLQYAELRSIGLSSKEASKYRSLSEEAFKKKLKYLKQREHKKENQEMIVFGYQEYTHGHDPVAWWWMKQVGKTQSRKQILEGIIEGMKTGSMGALIGDYRVDVIHGNTELNNLMDIYREHGFIPIHTSNGQNLQSLLNGINLMLSMLYKSKHASFLYDVVENLRDMQSISANDNGDFIEENIMSMLEDDYNGFL